MSDKELEVYQQLNNESYGEQLAVKVTQKLNKDAIENNGLYHSHRDYCGLGLFLKEGKYLLATVNDGYGSDVIVAEFDSEDAFVSWLANENNQSMALYGEYFNNQTISRIRLEWYLENNYSPRWNSFCLYVGNKI